MIHPADEKGLGLLEVLAALALLSLGVVSVFAVFSNAQTWNQNAAWRTRSVLLASGVIEELKARPDKVVSGEGIAVQELGLNMEIPEGAEVTIDITDYDSLLNLYLVKVSSSWTVNGQWQSESLAAIIGGSD